MAKITKKDKRRVFTGLIILCAIIGFLGSFSFGYWKDIINNKKETKELTEKYNELLEEEEELNSKITKLQDDEYVAQYAREKYKISKDDEIIINVED